MTPRIPGLSYGAYTGSLAYPVRLRARRWDQGALAAVLDLVHPGQFKTLPPSQNDIAHKAWVMGLGDIDTFFHR